MGREGVWQGVDGVGMLQGEWEAGGREGKEGAWQEVDGVGMLGGGGKPGGREGEGE